MSDDTAAISDDDYNPQNCAHTALRRASRQLTQIYDEALAGSGLTAAQALLTSRLEGLNGVPGSDGPSLQALAAKLSMQLSALTHALRPLVRDGFVELIPDALDRRSKRARLTPLGLERTQQMYALWRQVNERLDLVLGTGATEQLRTLAIVVASPQFLEQMRTSK
jgi:DNA-binding MarR family transcriptional regulator